MSTDFKAIPTSEGFEIVIMESPNMPDGKGVLYLSTNDYKVYAKKHPLKNTHE